MAYPSQSTIRSYGGSAIPTYLTAPLAGSYSSGQTISVQTAATWYEVDANGQLTSNPLGTSGPFAIKVDFSLATEETILCSAVNVSTGVITVWTDGTNNGRGYDGTPIVAHSAGSTPNVFPTATATEELQLNAGVVSALATASSASATASSALSTANSAQSAANAAQSTANTALANAATAQSTANTAEADAQTGITNAATAQGTANTALSVANAALPKSGGTMTGTIAMGGSKITGLANGTASTDAAAFGQIPTSLPPSGSAGGDLTGTYPSPTLTSTANVQSIITAVSPAGARTPTGSAGGDLSGTYPNPTIAALSPSPAGTYGSGTAIPVVTVDAKGRVTSVSTATPTTDAPSGPAGGDLAGTYPNPSLAAAGTAGTYGSSTLIPVITTDSKGRVTSVTTAAPSDATKLPLTGGTLSGALNGTTATWSGEDKATDFYPTGLTGATAATRYVGGTANGAPTSGTFKVGDFIVDQTATVWVCTTAGTPGTWSPTISSHIVLRSASATANREETTVFSGSTAGQTITAPANPIDGSTWKVINKASVSVTLSFTPSMIPLGGSTGLSSYTVSANGSYSFINYGGSQWYMIAANGADHLVDYSSVALSAWGAATANVAMGSNKITGLANGTASSDAAAFGQIPTALPPNGSAGGDLTGTYPNPTLATAYSGSSPVGSATAIPVLTIDTKGRITATSTAAPVDSTKVPTTTTISTTAPLAGGGALSGNLTLSLGTTGPGAGSLGTTASQTPQLTVDAYGRITAVTNATINDSTKLPLAGGTMSGAIAMGSNRISGLAVPGSTTDPTRAGDFQQQVPPTQHVTVLGGLKAWTFDLATTPSSTFIPTSTTVYYAAVYVPQPVTFTYFLYYLNTLGSSITNNSMGLYSTDGRQLLAYGILSSSTGGTVGANYPAISQVWNGSAFVSGTTYTIATPGTYWLAYETNYSGTGPTLVRTNQTNAAFINVNSQAGTSGTLYGRTNTSNNPGTSPFLYTNLTTSGVATTSSASLPWFAIL